MKIVSRNKIVYSFGPKHQPAENVKLGETILIETEDAFGGQIKNEIDSLETLDWSKVDGVTGPIFVEDAEPGDTLVVEILDVRVEKEGVIVTIPQSGVLARSQFGPSTKVVEISDGCLIFDEAVQVKVTPMIGTIGVTPENEIPTSSLGKHGGNMDVKELVAGTKLYLPVFMEGALFAAGDLHAVQADGELCVSAIEVAGEIVLRFSLIKSRRAEWPILETKDSYSFLTCGDTLDEAAKFAAEAAVKAFMREYSWPFEKAYMFGSLAVDLKINQVVDPRKGVRATISKDFIGSESLFAS